MSEWNIDRMRKIAGLREGAQQSAKLITEGSTPDAVLTVGKVHQLIESVGFTKTKSAIQAAFDAKEITGSVAQSFIRVLNTARGEDKFVLEGWDDDDQDEDPDVKIASGDKRQQAFEKRNKKELKSADKAADAKAKQSAEEKAKESKPDAEKAEPAEKKDEPAEAKAKQSAEEKAKESKPDAEKAEPAEKKDEPAEAKRRGKAPNEGSFNQQAKKYAKEHTRASFIKWAMDTHGKGKNYSSALFAKYNPKSGRESKITEAQTVWGIVHPTMAGFTLADNRELNQMQWIDSSSALDSLIFTTEAEAQKVAKYMAEWKSQSAVVEKYDFSDLADNAQ